MSDSPYPPAVPFDRSNLMTQPVDPEVLAAQRRADLAQYAETLRKVGPSTRGPARKRERITRGRVCRRGHDGEWLRQPGGFYCAKCRADNASRKAALAALEPSIVAERWAIEEDYRLAVLRAERARAEWQAKADAAISAGAADGR